MRKWYIAGAGLAVLMFALLVVLLVTGDGDNDNHIYVYFFNPYTRQMQAEVRPLPEEGFQIQQVIKYLSSDPVRSGSLVSTWPMELAPEPEDLVSAVKLEASTLYAFFTPVFHDMLPLEQSLFKAAFIHTMSSLPSVSDIVILVTEDYVYAFEILMHSLAVEDDEDAEDTPNEDDDYVPYMPLIIYDSSHAGVLIDPLDPPISPHWIDNYAFNHLHFVDSTGSGLVVESYTVRDVIRQDEQLAMVMLELLIEGPRQEGALALIPSETRVLDVEIVLHDMFVNLSGDFMTRFTSGQELAYLMIYSIVNTLIAEFPTLTRVHFLIDNLQIEQFHGVENFDLGFVRNDALLLSYIEAQRYAYEYEYNAEEDE